MEKQFIKKIEFFLNAIYYGMWRNNVRQGIGFYQAMSKLKYVLPKRVRARFYQQQTLREKEYIKLLNDPNEFLSMGLANYKLGYFYSAYPLAIAFIIVATIMKVNGDINDGVAFLIFAIFIGVAHIPLYRAVFYNNRYLKYYKEFKKKDARWQRKWSWIARGFCLLAVIFALLSIVLAFVIGQW